LGRSRKPEEEKTKSITINLLQKVINEISKDGNPKHVIEKIINDIYKKK
jgi:hypothetical protein